MSRGKRFWRSTDEDRKAARTAPGKKAEKGNEGGENTRVPDFRCAAHSVSDADRYTRNWIIFCTVILGRISLPVDKSFLADNLSTQVEVPNYSRQVVKRLLHIC